MNRAEIEDAAREFAIASLNFTNDEKPEDWRFLIDSVVKDFIAGAELILVENERLIQERDELIDAFFAAIYNLPEWAFNDQLKNVMRKYQERQVMVQKE